MVLASNGLEILAGTREIGLKQQRLAVRRLSPFLVAFGLQADAEIHLRKWIVGVDLKRARNRLQRPIEMVLTRVQHGQRI